MMQLTPLETFICLLPYFTITCFILLICGLLEKAYLLVWGGEDANR